MSSNHKAPLAAFVVVAIACVVVLATNSMRSYAVDAWRSFAAPVVNGLSLLPSDHHEPAKAVVASDAVLTADPATAPSVPALDVATLRRHHSGHKARHAATVAPAAVQQAGNASAAAPVAAPVPPVPAKPAAPKPAATYVPAHGAYGEHHGWSQGRHNGWSHADHGGPSYGNASSGSHGNSAKHATHGPSWKASKTYASNAVAMGDGAEPAAVTAGSHGNSAHGNGHGNNGHGGGASKSHGHSGH